MPDYEYRLWNEDNFDVNCLPYSQEAYACNKFAFVSDVARLIALRDEGGIYLDVDFFVYKPFDDLLSLHAFAGFEGSKYNPVMMGVVASEANGIWVNEQLSYYCGRHFLIDKKEDLTTNVTFISNQMALNGFVTNGKEQDYKDLHIFPSEYFCPQKTSGEYNKTEKTYCEQLSHPSSWAKSNWKTKLLRFFNPATRTRIILLKRKLLG